MNKALLKEFCRALFNEFKEYGYNSFACENGNNMYAVMTATVSTRNKLIKSGIFIPDFKVFTGATKAVIIFKNCNFVVKIPYRGEYEGETFRGANNSKNNWDYCQKEIDVYNSAKAKGLQSLFPKVELVCGEGYMKVYIQQRVSQRLPPNTKSYQNSTVSIGGYYYPAYMIKKQYGEDVLNTVKELLEEHNVGDFHRGNVGTRNNKFVILDYSGYHG